MALILHVADLHLVAPSASLTLDDHKVSLVSPGSRITHHDTLKLTLQRLGELLVNSGRALDAIVATGDVADKNNEGGYSAFQELIEALGPVKPSNDRILVLPGNHDIVSGLSPGDAKRYEKFLKYIRAEGYVTPWLSGIDRMPASKAEARRHIVQLDDVQIIPIDTAGYSQVRLDVGISDSSWKKLEDALVGNPEEMRNLQRLRIADAARVSEDQLEAVRRIVKLVTPSGKIPLRIAAIHHHLLPVSAKEEIKPFESLTNLGLVRQFLRDQEIAIVLHGHKHTAFTYVDYISSYENSPSRPCPVRVISGASATALDLDRDDLFRLLEIQINAGIVELSRVGAAMSGMELAIGSAETLTFARMRAAQVSGTDGCLIVEGDLVSDVYPLLVAAVENRGPEAEHVLCRVGSSPQLDQIAPLYPVVFPTTGPMDGETEPGIAAAKHLEQFTDIVHWWQYPSLPQGPFDQPTFTHGSRIKRYEGHLDQIATVVSALSTDPKTSRGIVVLLNPPADRISERDVPFPSFCLVQFKVRKSNDGPPALDCTAYFRKQEVRFWWLVNLAELSELQREICAALAQRRGTPELKKIRPGSITTIAVRAHAGQSAPKVQVPLVDRYYSLERERLVGMINSLVWNGMPNRQKHTNEWLRLFAELQPPENPDPDGLAVALNGIEYLMDEISRHLGSGSPQAGSLQELHHALEQLLNANRGFALAQQKEEVTADGYASWRNLVEPLIAKIIELSYGSVVTLNQQGRQN
jgi:3',5'-cyclic AMP phosphodiesterase CpdA